MAFGSVQIAPITGAAPGGAVSAEGIGSSPIGPNLGLLFGGAGAAIVYGALLGDLFVIAKGPGGEDIVTGSFFDPASPPTWLPTIAAGELAIGNKAGAYLRFTAAGDIVLVPASGRDVLLGAAGAAVARVGDPVSASGSDPQGGTVSVTGTITGSSSEVKA